MGFLNRLFGDTSPQQQPLPNPPPSADEQALARYRYLLRTAPPDAVEQAHQEAFSQLTPQQRAQVLSELSRELPAAEQAPGQTDPASLARLATRAEMRQPGTLERTLGRGPGMGGMFAGSLLSSIAGTFIGTAIAHQFLDGFHGSPEGAADPDSAHAEADTPDADGDDFGGDFGDV
jgi:hypothetical protein